LIVYVDLSAKVEQWERDSVVAACNGVARVYLIPGRVKQQLRRWLMSRYRRTSIHYRAFALFVYLAIREDLAAIDQVIIDQDYTGADVEGTIKNLLLDLMRAGKPGVTAGFIRFENVADSTADVYARETFMRKRAPDRTVSFEDLLAILEK
jgi:hypothetical protein